MADYGKGFVPCKKCKTAFSQVELMLKESKVAQAKAEGEKEKAV